VRIGDVDRLLGWDVEDPHVFDESLRIGIGVVDIVALLIVVVVF
jgi:hypothetical protein